MSVFKLNTYSRLFLYAALFWTFLGLLHLISLSLDEPAASRLEFLSKQRLTLFISAYLCWSFLTVFLYYLIELHPPAKHNIRWLINLLLTAIVWLAIITVFNQSLSNFLWAEKTESIATMLSEMPPFLYLFNFVKVLLVYSACAGIFFYRRMQESRYQLLQLEREHMEIREKESRFQLQALQSQLSPHFLFNCLNTISGLARTQDMSAITAAIANLGGLLRYVLDGTNQTQVYLDEEIRFTQHYIALQQSRFSDCFQFSLQVQIADTYVPCPPFCIQTLVENVFSHNDLSRDNPIRINVNIVEKNDFIHIAVENFPILPNEYKGIGVGLTNLKERLSLLYGDAGSISTVESDNGFNTSVIFPIGHDHD